MIDTHAHLDFPQFDRDRDRVIEEAFTSGVETIINIGIDLETSRRSIRLAEAYERIYATIGFHPHNASQWNKDACKELEKMAAHPKVVAIGEIGLDFYRNLSPKQIQVRAFREQIDLAMDLDLPIVIHVRQAHGEALGILSEYFHVSQRTNEAVEEKLMTDVFPGLIAKASKRSGRMAGLRGVLHCFSGDEKEAWESLKLGFLLAFNGTLTYRNSRSAQVVKKLPLHSLLTETDCPYLAPEPFRGKRNEPLHVKPVLEKMVELLPSQTFQELEECTSRNARHLFALDSA